MYEYKYKLFFKETETKIISYIAKKNLRKIIYSKIFINYKKTMKDILI